MNQNGIPLGSGCMLVMFQKVLTSAIVEQNETEKTKTENKQKKHILISPQIKLSMLKGIQKWKIYLRHVIVEICKSKGTGKISQLRWEKRKNIGNFQSAIKMGRNRKRKKKHWKFTV